MNTKHWIALIGITAGLALAADYTVPRTWTRTGAEYAKNSLSIFDPINVDTPVEIRVRVKTVDGERTDIWTPETVALLPDTITVNGNTMTNVAKLNLKVIFERHNVVRAYNWGLVTGREAGLVPVQPEPEPEPTPEP
jgi:hypothetical protein